MSIGNVDIALSTLSSYENSSSVSTSSLAYAVSTAVLSNSLDMEKSLGNSMVKMMESSVNPAVGGNFDTYI